MKNPIELTNFGIFGHFQLKDSSKGNIRFYELLFKDPSTKTKISIDVSLIQNKFLLDYEFG